MGVEVVLLCALVLLLNVQQHHSKQMTNCSNPPIELSEHVQLLHNVNGLKHKEVNVIYDFLHKRTEFIHVLLDDSSLHQPPLMINPKLLMGTGQLVPFVLGGSDDPMNLFPQTQSCRMHQWQDFINWIKVDVETFGQVNYCVQLIYPDDQTNAPSQVIGHVRSYPDDNVLFHVIALNNSLERIDCENAPLDLDVITK